MGRFDWEDFKVGFWQAFGPYGGMAPKDIVRSKHEQLENGPWTLWSFSAGANQESLHRWLGFLHESKSDPWVLLSHSRGTTEPKGTTSKYHQPTRYRTLGAGTWKEIPQHATTGVYLKRGGKGVAYVVREQVVLRCYYDDPDDVRLSWYSRGADSWQRGQALPPRPPTFPIRRDDESNARPRPCAAVLKLQDPYLVLVR